MNISNEVVDFLKDLKENNNRDWFMANKNRYEKAKVEFEIFIKNLLAEISSFDPLVAHHKPKDCIFRIFRDVRFSKDKSPYKTHFGAHITPATRKSDIHTQSGYYIHLEPQNNSLLAGGAYLPQGNWLKKIREEIDYNGQELKTIIDSKDFKDTFYGLEGEKLIKIPKGFDVGSPHAELLKMKSFLAMYKVKDGVLIKNDFSKIAVTVFKTMKPLNDFLNRCIQE